LNLRLILLRITLGNFSFPLHSEPGSLQMVQIKRRSAGVKIATCRMGGERRVGVVDDHKQTVSPFDIAAEDAAHGVLALIGRAELPRILFAIPLREADIEAPIVRPRRNIHVTVDGDVARIEIAGIGMLQNEFREIGS
jgi:hypothetical protein